MIRVLAENDPEAIRKILERLGVDEVGVGMMVPKAHHHLLQIESLNVPAANILKQEMLSVGADVALHKGACDFSIPETPCLLMGTYQQYLKVCRKLQLQPFGLKKIGKEIRKTLSRFWAVPDPIKAGPYTIDFSGPPLIMGILNMTPDSFSGDGLGYDLDALLRKAEQMIREGADLLDIGGESTRPGATPVDEEEELRRIIPAVRAVARAFSVPIAVDTSKAQVARLALEAGAHLINDVWGLQRDPEMAAVARAFNAPVVVTHNREKAEYTDLVGEICAFFAERLQTLEGEGIPEKNILLDPGIGFGKTMPHNLEILKNLSELRVFGRPILLGVSRKSFIGILSGAPVEARVPGSLAAAALGLARGCHIFRVHDVGETRQALQVARAILQGGI